MRAIFDGWASDSETTRYVGWPTHQTLDDTYAFIAFSDDQWQKWGCGPLLIEHCETGTVIGSAGFAFFGAGTMVEKAEVGYVIAPEHRRRGYATEALRQSITLAQARGVMQLSAGVHPANTVSRHIVENHGFVPGNPSTIPVIFPQINPNKPEHAINYVLDF